MRAHLPAKFVGLLLISPLLLCHSSGCPSSGPREKPGAESGADSPLDTQETADSGHESGDSEETGDSGLEPGPHLGEQATLMEGQEIADDAGFTVAAAGDLDGDGLRDLLVGAPRADLPLEDAGALYLLHGPARDLGSLSKADLVFHGESFDDHAGWALSGDQDLTGDGLPELLVGAIWENSLKSGGGAAYLLSPPWDADPALDDALIRVLGDEAGAFSGSAVALLGAEDPTGGFAVSALSSSREASLSGAVALFFAPFDEPLVLFSQADALLTGPLRSEQAGTSLGGGGDLDGDGLGDLVVGAPSEYRVADGKHGRIYVLSGPITGSRSLSDAEWILEGEEDSWCAGSSVAADQDLDGDGHADLLIGAACAHTDIEGDAGRVWLLLGPLSEGVGLRSAHAVMYGENAARKVQSGWEESEQAGGALDFAGDLDGDGRQEILIGAPRAGGRGTRSGALYLVSGTVEGSVQLQEQRRWWGEQEGDLAGSSVAGLGDVDGAGFGEILVGAPGAAGPGGAYCFSP